MRILFVENQAVFARTVIEQFLFEHSLVVVASASEALNALRDSAFVSFSWTTISTIRKATPSSGICEIAVHVRQL